jgi:hypothetical protein
MCRVFISFAAAGLALMGILDHASAADTPPIAIAIVDFDYVDTSGEVGDQTKTHDRLLQTFKQTLAHDLTVTGQYRIVALSCGADPCTSRTDPLALQKAARAAGVKLVVIGGFHKMSTLVQWAKVQIFDADAGHVLFDRLVTFRNDSDDAWTRAEIFLFHEIEAAQVALAAPSPAKPLTKLAVFEFELEDFSGGAGIIAESADDRAQLHQATEDVRRLLTQSGHYSLVDVASVDAQPAKDHELRKCNGCDAALAKNLGADQSLVGIVTRITRTDYAVTFRLRNAQTGAVIAVEQTDLRIGANYSWNRGAMWLIQRRLLDKQG